MATRPMTKEELLKQNTLLTSRLTQLRQQISPSNLEAQLQNFLATSKESLAQLNQQLVTQAQKEGEKLKELSLAYEKQLKRQVELLGRNKELVERRGSGKDGKGQVNSKVWEERIAAVVKEYQGKIKQCEERVKINVKKIKAMGDGNSTVRQLLNNDKFRAALEAKGVSKEALLRQAELDTLSAQLEDKEELIEEADARSAKLDDQLAKTHELIETMKELMDNMVKEKENIKKQNLILKEKLKQSEQLIGRLLGAGAGEEAIAEDEEEDTEETEEEAKKRADSNKENRMVQE